MHGEQKCRTKTMRVYDNDRGAESLSQGYRVHYNLVKEHMTLGKTPGEAAGIKSFSGFKWRGIIEKGVELEAERKRNLPPPPELERTPLRPTPLKPRSSSSSERTARGGEPYAEELQVNQEGGGTPMALQNRTFA